VDLEHEKQVAAEAAAPLVRPGMRVGLGTGSTVAYLLPALAERGADATYVATSPLTEQAARALGLRVGEFDRELDHLDLAIDGADQVTPDGWLVKGHGGAQTRERIVASAADEFIVIVDSSKLVERIVAPVPLELLSFGLSVTLRALAHAVLRDAARTPDGGVLADWLGDVGDPADLAARLDAAPGVVAHGLFEPSLVGRVLVGRGDTATWVTPGGAS
jgi:ribose 5-phosphate isomerase A